LSRAFWPCLEPCLAPILALIALHAASAQAQRLTPALFNPERGGFAAPQELPLQRSAGVADDALSDPNSAANPDSKSDTRPRERDRPAPSRIGRIPTYGLPAASGAADSGFDSLNRKRQRPKYYPGQARPKPPAGPGTPPPATPQGSAAGQLRLSIPPSQTANKPPIAPAMAGSVPGQPQRKRLKLDDDPFGSVGDYAGSFLVKSALELSASYDSNPGRTFQPKGLPSYVIAPEFLAVSDWERHALVADLRGSFTGYGGSLPQTLDGGVNSAPTNVDRPDFTGHVDGRLDVFSDTDVTAQGRVRVATDNPGRARALSARHDGGRYLRLRPALQPPAGLGRRHRRPHLVSELDLDRWRGHVQRRPQLQSIWRGRADLLRADAGCQTVR
jgi:hypothetical protein